MHGEPRVDPAGQLYVPPARRRGRWCVCVWDGKQCNCTMWQENSKLVLISDAVHMYACRWQKSSFVCKRLVGWNFRMLIPSLQFYAVFWPTSTVHSKLLDHIYFGLEGWSCLDIGLKSEVLDKIVMNLWIMKNSIEFMRVVKQKLKAYRTRVVKPYEWNGMLPDRVWWPCTYICLEAAFDLHGLTNAVTRWLTGINM